MPRVLSSADIGKAVDNYVDLLQRTIDKVRVGLNQETVELIHGRKYIKVIITGNGRRSVHSFIDRSTGQLYKPASWNAPSKTTMYNIVNDFSWLVIDIDPYGAYLYKRNPFKK